jgi:hypothetical protein
MPSASYDIGRGSVTEYMLAPDLRAVANATTLVTGAPAGSSSPSARIGDLVQRVRVVTTEDIALDGSMTDYDGVTFDTGDLVLVNAQSDASENRIYRTGSSGWVPFSSSIDDMQLARVTEGTFAGTIYELATDGSVVIGMDDLYWLPVRAQVSQATARDSTGSSGTINLTTLSPSWSVPLDSGGTDYPGDDLVYYTGSSVANVRASGLWRIGFVLSATFPAAYTSTLTITIQVNGTPTRLPSTKAYALTGTVVTLTQEITRDVYLAADADSVTITVTAGAVPTSWTFPAWSLEMELLKRI